MNQQFFQRTLPNGLTIVIEPMDHVRSAAMVLLIEAGSATDPVNGGGSATILSDLILRGAGDYDSRQLSDAMDDLGLQRSSGAGVHHTRIGAVGLADALLTSLPIYADIVQRAHLPEEGADAARDLALQAIEGIDDDPRQQLLIRLHECHFPYPLGRDPMGVADEIRAMTQPQLAADYHHRYQPAGAILSIAGGVNPQQAMDEIQKYFGDWMPRPRQDMPLRPPPGRWHHQQQESEQTHIGLAYPSLPETHADYYTMRLAMEILSGGMSGRLFTEVREKRGLAYNVSAGYFSLRGMGSIMGYAGTSSERAQATLETMMRELYRMGEGVTESELQRARTGLKSATIMQGESTSARAGACSHDVFMRGYARSLDEISSAMDAVSLEKVNQWLAENPPKDFTYVTVGPRELIRPVELIPVP